MIDTTWWSQQEPSRFLASNWDHPSRAIGTDAALDAVGRGTLVEVGPGSGIDYARAFRSHVLRGALEYVGWEATGAFCAALQAQYPEAVWHHAPLQHLLPLSCDVIYARAVLEHQPDPLAALATLLAAARGAVILDWYRPPAALSRVDLYSGVPCHTVRRASAMDVIDRAGFRLTGSHTVDGNEVWALDRVAREEPPAPEADEADTVPTVTAKPAPRTRRAA